jgi:hypothetical protein
MQFAICFRRVTASVILIHAFFHAKARKKSLAQVMHTHRHYKIARENVAVFLPLKFRHRDRFSDEPLRASGERHAFIDLQHSIP